MNVSRTLTTALIALLALSVGSCAHRPKGPPGVSIDQRPTPPQPPTEAAKPAPSNGTPSNGSSANGASSTTAPSRGTGGANATEEPRIETVMSPEERKLAMTRVVADTTAASAAVKKCSTRRLLPDQESVFETTQSLLAQTRGALARDEVWRAESLARKARQLAASLDCP